jgi:hypothetical protein
VVKSFAKEQQKSSSSIFDRIGTNNSTKAAPDISGTKITFNKLNADISAADIGFVLFIMWWFLIML